MKLQDALPALRFLSAAASVEGALEHLVAVQEQYRLLHLYQHFFPAEYTVGVGKRARAPVGSVHPSGDISSSELEFLQLVNDRLFPLNLFWIELLAEESDGWHLKYIPIDSLSCLQCDFSLQDADAPLATRLLCALLFGEDEEGDWNGLLAGIDTPPPIMTGAYSGIDFDFEHFTRLCRRAGGMLVSLPLGVQCVSHSTGNFWLDVPEFEGQDVELDWNIEVMNWLAKDWETAPALYKKYEQLVAWLQAEPVRLGKVIELWNRCCT